MDSFATTHVHWIVSSILRFLQTYAWVVKNCKRRNFGRGYLIKNVTQWYGNWSCLLLPIFVSLKNCLFVCFSIFMACGIFSVLTYCRWSIILADITGHIKLWPVPFLFYKFRIPKVNQWVSQPFNHLSSNIACEAVYSSGYAHSTELVADENCVRSATAPIVRIAFSHLHVHVISFYSCAHLVTLTTACLSPIRERWK